MLMDIFSFPRTGVWTINLDTMYYSNATDKSMVITIHGSSDDFSSQTTIGTTYTSLHYSSINSNAQSMLMGHVMFFLIVQI